MRILFIGSVEFSLSALKETIQVGGDVVAVCTLKDSKFNSDFCDLTNFSKKNDIPCLYADDINSSESISWISKHCPDVIFCFGWSRLIKKELLSIPKLGVIGFHPASLPYNRGRHPIIWAIALGLDETASTFFFMDEGADSGDIISQTKIRIHKTDNSRTLYNKITISALDQINKIVPQLQNNSFERFKQNHSLANSWRKRTQKDGLIDWRMSDKSITNLVKALSKPYIGASFIYKDMEYKVWETRVILEEYANSEPGKVVNIIDNGIVVKCGNGIICLTSIEPEIDILKGEYL